MAKIATKKGMEQHSIPIKKPVSSKQPSLISSTRKIQKSKEDTQVRMFGPFLAVYSI